MHGPHLRLVPPPAAPLGPPPSDRQPDLALGDRDPSPPPDPPNPGRPDPPNPGRPDPLNPADPGSAALLALDALLTAGPLDDDACARLAALAALVPGRQRAATALLGLTASGAAVDALLTLPGAPGQLEALTRCLARGATRRFPPLSLVDPPLARKARPGAPPHLSPETAPTRRPDADDPPPVDPLSLGPGPEPRPPHLSSAPGPEPQPPHLSSTPGVDPQPPRLSFAPGPDARPPHLSSAPGPDPQPPNLSSAPGPDARPTAPGPRLPPRRPGAAPRVDDGPPGPVDAPRVLALDFRSSRTRSFPDLVRRAQAVADVARSVAVFEALAVADQPGGRIHYRLSVLPDRAPAAALAAALRAAHLDLTWLHARLVRLRGTRLWLNGWSFADDHPIGPAAQAHLLQAWLRWAEQEPAP